MGSLKPSGEADKEYQNSILATSQLTDAIYNSEFEINEEVQSQISKELQKSRYKVKRSSRACTEHSKQPKEMCSLPGIWKGSMNMAYLPYTKKIWVSPE